MIDRRKRNTLKLISGSGLLAAAGPAATLLNTAVAGTAEQTGNAQTGDLEILVIDTSSMPEDTAIVTNRTNADLEVTDFKPGTIFFNGKWLSLNQVFANALMNGRILPPGHSVSAPIAPQALDHGTSGDYLWAQQCVEPLTENTDIVRLAAVMHDRRAIVYTPASGVAFS